MESTSPHRLIVAGGRNYQFSLVDIAFLDYLHSKLVIEEVVSGGASGADSEGERWAESNRIPIKRFPADWGSHGKAAGPIRNEEMASYATAVVLFPGGKGTASMFGLAKKHNLLVLDRR